MAKKKLTKNQQRRIKGHQQAISSSNPHSGQIISHYGKYVDVENNLNKIIRCHLRQNLPELAVGDNVIYCVDSGGTENQTNTVVTKLLTRRSLLERKNKYKGTSKPIAANLDQIFIIFSPEPEPQSYLIDQFLIISEISNITPILIFNKYDIYQAYLDKKQDDKVNSIDKLIDIYQNIGYKVLKISTLQDYQFKDIQELLYGKTSIFVGQSGVGKSTLTKELIPYNNLNQEIKTGEISEKSLLGKHTTSVARLYHLENNGRVIDAPGIREMGVAHLSKTELEQAYTEFKPFLNKCKFRDCQHDREPDCALKQALADGFIHPVRWENFKRFATET